jgi:hypothetical protein
MDVTKLVAILVACLGINVRFAILFVFPTPSFVQNAFQFWQHSIILEHMLHREIFSVFDIDFLSFLDICYCKNLFTLKPLIDPAL